ncbi:MAG: TetR/AcrR family transcriptional regulator [Ruminococcus sp.]|nr:TetR/AcrR family transcriptional regulator [Ruminococcus sp.]
MPPKCKFTKDEIIAAALDIAREQGLEAVTARALGDKLSSSSKPIFSIFENMEQVQEETLLAARALYNEYIAKALASDQPFREVGSQYIRFAVTEPKLFQMLFMSEQTEKRSALGILPMIDDNYEDILASVQKGYGLDETTAKSFYRHLWIYTHGIASLIATGVCSFRPEEIGEMVAEIFVSLLKNSSCKKQKEKN